ncbi:MAG: DNA polymerase III subunit delta [Burkholderiales bacterium]|nr:DNA polymerase III subunit delta [Phycisphaerae bacterium]
MPAVHAMVGEDTFLQLEAIRRIAAALGKDAQRIDFDGETAQLADVMDELRSFSMFAGTKLVVLRTAEEFISRYRSNMEEYVAAPVETATLVLRCKSLPGNQKISKLIAKHGKVEMCEPPKGRDLTPWIVSRAKTPHGLTIAPGAAQLMAELVGNDLGRLDNELAKLALMVDGKVTEADVGRSVVFQRDQEMWHMTDELTAGRVDKALQRWRQLVQSDSSTEFRAVTWLAIWLEKALKAMKLKQKNMNPFAIAKELRIWPANNVDSLLRTAERMGSAGLARALDLLAEVDHRSKSGLGDASDNVERFILSLAKT